MASFSFDAASIALAQLPTLPSEQFWRGKRVLLTGHTGFKGAWLAQWLVQMGAQVTAIGLAPYDAQNLHDAARVAQWVDGHIGDITDLALVERIVKQCQPEVVLHLAAQALVRKSYDEPVQTFATNVLGTAHVLQALRGVDTVRSIVVVTTDKVYANQEWLWAYRENEPLGGYDPYSASKAATEMVVGSFRNSYFNARGVALMSVRAGNVIGGGDWSLDRIVPDAVRAWQKGVPLSVRRPDAVRPWQHVVEPLCGYLLLAERGFSHPKALSQAWNLGPNPQEAATVRDVVALAQQTFTQTDKDKRQAFVEWGDNNQGPHEAGLLMLDPSLIRINLGFKPVFSLKQAIDMSISWYNAYQQGEDAQQLCQKDIAYYVQMARASNPNNQ